MSDHSTTQIRIFYESKRINITYRADLWTRVHSSYTEYPLVDVSVTGLFLPDHQILILKQDVQRAVSSFEMTKIFHNLVPRKILSYTLSLSDAARECVRYTDVLFRELDQLVDPPKVTSPQVAGGGPYRSLPPGSKLLGS